MSNLIAVIKNLETHITTDVGDTNVMLDMVEQVHAKINEDLDTLEASFKERLVGMRRSAADLISECKQHVRMAGDRRQAEYNALIGYQEPMSSSEPQAESLDTQGQEG